MEKTRDPMHSFKHGERVARNAKKIVEILGLQKSVDLNLLRVACLLHDLPISSRGLTLVHHFLEPWFVRHDMPGILNQLDLTDKQKKTILSATVNHTFSYPYRRLNRNKDNYSKILQDADTLDLFSPEREETFKKNKNFSLTYREMNIFARLFFSFGEEHLAWYLNFPEVARHLREIYN